MSIQQKLAVLGLCSVLSTAPAGCHRGNEVDDPGIDVPTLTQANPSAERPIVHFPSHCQQTDQSLNAFVVRVLEICEKGDFDGFCQFLGTTEKPPSQESFKRLWQGIKEIDVKSVRGTGEDKPEFFVHAVARLRKPDSEKRTERDLVIRIYKEMDEWRISGAPKDIIRRVLAADSQPASAPVDSADRPSTSQPVGAGPGAEEHSAPSAAPPANHGVYKNKAKTHEG